MGAWPGNDNETAVSVGSLLAVRSFSISYKLSTSDILWSTWMNHTFRKGINTATCTGMLRSGSHQAPFMRCTCGFYAKKWEHRFEYPSQISGIVRLSGRVIEGTRGYRASKLEVIGLFTMKASIARLYDAWMIPPEIEETASSIEEAMVLHAKDPFDTPAP